MGWGGGEFSQQTRAAVKEGLMKLSRWEVAGDPLRMKLRGQRGWGGGASPASVYNASADALSST